jgi:hypothetical protein
MSGEEVVVADPAVVGEDGDGMGVLAEEATATAAAAGQDTPTIATLLMQLSPLGSPLGAAADLEEWFDDGKQEAFKVGGTH